MFGRDIHCGLQILKKGIRRRIGNGFGTSVWEPGWLGELGLADCLGGNFDHRDSNLRVADLIGADKRWDLDKMHSNIPVEIKNKFVQIPIAWMANTEDGYSWKWARDGKFYIKNPPILIFV